MTTLNLEKLWESIADVPHENKVTAFLKNGGVEFYDKDCRFVKSPKVALVGVGGIPIESLTPGVDLSSSTKKMMGMAGAFSYMNPKATGAERMAEICFGHNHFSISHVVTVNILLLGYSIGVENEINSQRDLAHLSRLTVARTKAQNKPPLVVLDESHLPFYVSAVAHMDGLVTGAEAKGDSLESLNLLYPAAKASVSMLTGSLRNIQKMLGALKDTGKEMEYLRLLAGIRDCLQPHWPEIYSS